MSNGNLGTPQSRRGQRRRRSKRGLMSEINVTPFVDVMLVLLIVFMVAAPLLVTGVPLELPKTSAGAVKIDSNPLTVSVDQNGRFAVGDKFFKTSNAVVLQLKVLSAHNNALKKERIFVRGAKGIAYEKVLELIAAIQKAGFTNVALASLPKNG